MKILFVTPQSPETFGGGGMVINGHLRALTHLFGARNVFYVGPQSSTENLDIYDNKIITKKIHTVDKIRAVLIQRSFMSSEISLFKDKDRFTQILKESDMVWIETTKLGYLVKHIKRDLDSDASKPVICFAHNNELEYFRQSERKIYYAFRHSILESEELTSTFADKIIFGSKEMLENFSMSYQRKNGLGVMNMFTHISSKKSIELPSDYLNKAVAFSGSFKYKHNVDALKQILRLLSTNKYEFYVFILGSGFERMKLQRFRKMRNIAFVVNPYNEIDILKFIPIYVNPVVSMGGVLVKNIVAMSAGSIIVGINGAFKGYESSPFLEVSSLRELFDLSEQLLQKGPLLDSYRLQTLDYFNKNHSLEYGIHALASLLD